jgi:hypothetical protein
VCCPEEGEKQKLASSAAIVAERQFLFFNSSILF